MVVMMKGDLDLEVEIPLVEIRKGPWTEEEDMQLMCFVGLFGERRWDFIAKVSGLRRTGKSCRLRWVNYLHPGLKRGRMTPEEERLVLELHARWGNRWSRIARKLPGRTDNEIKNYWRTHMRKKAQERKSHEDATTTTSIITSSSSSSLCSTIQTPTPEAATTTTNTTTKTIEGNNNEVDEVKGYPMEKIWDDIASSEINHDYSNYHDGENITICCCPPTNPPISSPPIWDYCSNETPIWKMDEEEELKMLMSMDGFHGLVTNYHHGKVYMNSLGKVV